MKTKPFIKWVGGKTQILDQVLDKIPENIGNYYEPFLGGGSILFGVLENKKVHGTVYASDINPHLIALYKSIQEDPETLIKNVQELAREVSELRYYEVRADFNESPSPDKFMYLNKTCFRGLYREGPHGFNVPWGHYDAPNIIDPIQIRMISTLIKNVVFVAQSFHESLKGPILDADFVYLDPPYVDTFGGYTRRGFNLVDHIELFRLVRELPQFLMSNSQSPLVQENFEGFPQRALECRRAINARNPGAIAIEVLIWNNLH